jgi:hypothetical protein
MASGESLSEFYLYYIFSGTSNTNSPPGHINLNFNILKERQKIETKNCPQFISRTDPAFST